jgi:hypothetical protein
MSGLEVIELLAVLRAEVGRATMDFVTVMFGYLVCAHFIGAGLNRAIVIIMSLLYSIFAFYPMLGVATSQGHMWAVMSVHRESLLAYQELPEEIDGSAMTTVYFLVMFTTWLLSVGYMFYVRRNGNAT